MVDEIAIPQLDATHYAGFWVRFGAACIDLILYLPLYFAMGYGFTWLSKFLPNAASLADSSKDATDYAVNTIQTLGGPLHNWFEAAFFVVSLVTYAWFFASKWQGSPGMHLLKFHICDTEGRRITFKRALLWGVTGSIGLMICFAGVFYLQTKFDINAVNQLAQSCNEQKIDMDDCYKEIEDITHIPYKNYVSLLFGAAGMAIFLMFIWILSIALPKDKTGFHNLICHTRFVKGRPPASGREFLTVPA
jgi:uncharacterized RDD family membrane protein YckC